MSSSLKSIISWFMAFGRAANGRYAATVLLVGFAGLISLQDLAPFKVARLALFDQYQNLLPRHPKSQPVVIVEIDEATLGALGQWPWPRHYLASLIDAIADHKPTAIGLDIIMPEPDHASPQAIAESRPDLPKSVLNILTQSPSNDKILATSLSKAPTVLGAAAFSFRTSITLDGLRITPVLSTQEDFRQWLHTYPYVLASLPEFQAAASGQALLTGEPERGVTRRAAALAAINNSVTPGLSLEMMRIAYGAKNIVANANAHGIESASVGNLRIPLQANGEAWLHFDETSRPRYISALSVLKGETEAQRIAGKMVLIGLTGLGLQDMITTPFGDRRPGVEVHAQLIETFEDGRFLTRPWWLPWSEIALLLTCGLLLIWWLPTAKFLHKVSHAAGHSTESGIKPGAFIWISLVMAALTLGSGLAMFYWSGLLFDGVNLLTALTAVLRSLIFSAAKESDHQKLSALRELDIHRMEAAQLNGELNAARRIQLGTLPNPHTAFPDEVRFKIAAMLEPARQVGGDLYDFFMLDKRRLFFLIGDVSGKGLPSSLFMVVAKALAKNAALRGSVSVGAIITMANAEMARENPDKLSVALVAGVLDVESGVLEFVNAGHTAPWHIDSSGRVASMGGLEAPALCKIDNFHYPVQSLQLKAGESLLLFTDGITEAMNANNETYGSERIAAVLKLAPSNTTPEAHVAALRQDVRSFEGTTEPSDDLTLLVLQWVGPSASIAQ